MNIKSGDAKLVLLCPAWKNWGTARTVKADTVILHSRADDVIPFADSEELLRKSGLPACASLKSEPITVWLIQDHSRRCSTPSESRTNKRTRKKLSWSGSGLCCMAALRCTEWPLGANKVRSGPRLSRKSAVLKTGFEIESRERRASHLCFLTRQFQPRGWQLSPMICTRVVPPGSPRRPLRRAFSMPRGGGLRPRTSAGILDSRQPEHGRTGTGPV